MADILERKGLLREASELDSISNAIDKIAYIAKGRPPYSKFFPLVKERVKELLERLTIGNDKKIDSIVQICLTDLKPVQDEFMILKRGIFENESNKYIDDCLDYLNELEKAIKSKNKVGLSEFLAHGYDNFLKSWDDNVQMIHNKQMVIMKMPTGGKPF